MAVRKWAPRGIWRALQSQRARLRFFFPIRRSGSSVAINTPKDGQRVTITSKREYRESLARFAGEHFARFHITVELPPGRTRRELEHHIREFYIRMNRVFLGRSWYMPENAPNRMQGVGVIRGGRWRLAFALMLVRSRLRPRIASPNSVPRLRSHVWTEPPRHVLSLSWHSRDRPVRQERTASLLTWYVKRETSGRPPRTPQRSRLPLPVMDCDRGAPDRIRTCDLCLRRAALYPAELRVQRSALCPIPDWHGVRQWPALTGSFWRCRHESCRVRSLPGPAGRQVRAGSGLPGGWRVAEGRGLRRLPVGPSWLERGRS
jgi:hypothetical protein